jgi:aldehyde dehydrogenase (NAD+)
VEQAERRRARPPADALSAKVAEHTDELAAIEQRDCGKPTKQARPMPLALARYFEFYAGACDKLHGDTIPYLDGYSVLTWREPHGVVGHIIPWNYPMQIFGRSVGGALAAGNVCVVKPAEDACLSLIRVAQLAAEVGFPAGAINIVTGYGHEVGDALARHPGIDHISFTGSPKVGTLIQQVAAERHCPVTLELGGKSPQIVFADADLDAAMPMVINAIVQNAGQTCSRRVARADRAESIYEPLLERLGKAFEPARGPGRHGPGRGPADPPEPAAARVGLFERRPGGRHPHGGAGPGGGRSARNRLLPGPHPAARRAGGPPAGAGRGVWPGAVGHVLQGRRPRRATGQRHPASAWWPASGPATAAASSAWPNACSSGQVFINNYGAGGGVELPFGGVKSSGYGREKGFEALYGFTTLKTVAVKHGLLTSLAVVAFANFSKASVAACEAAIIRSACTATAATDSRVGGMTSKVSSTSDCFWISATCRARSVGHCTLARSSKPERTNFRVAPARPEPGPARCGEISGNSSWQCAATGRDNAPCG